MLLVITLILLDISIVIFILLFVFVSFGMKWYLNYDGRLLSERIPIFSIEISYLPRI